MTEQELQSCLCWHRSPRQLLLPMVLIASNLHVSDCCPQQKAAQAPSTISPTVQGYPCLGASLYSARSWLVQQIFRSRTESWTLSSFSSSIFKRRLMRLVPLLCSLQGLQRKLLHGTIEISTFGIIISYELYD